MFCVCEKHERSLSLTVKSEDLNWYISGIVHIFFCLKFTTELPTLLLLHLVTIRNILYIIHLTLFLCKNIHLWKDLFKLYLLNLQI
jgi:hypothetical protein